MIIVHTGEGMTSLLYSHSLETYSSLSIGRPIAAALTKSSDPYFGLAKYSMEAAVSKASRG